MSTQIWAVSSGKGGVGKTFICSSLGITLAKLKYKVLLVDFDITGANLHTVFGINPSEKNITSYLDNTQNLTNLIEQTNVPKLSIIQGFWSGWKQSNITSEQINNLMSEIKTLPFDYVIFDLAAGFDSTKIQILAASDEKIIVSNSEPTCIEKNYRLIESYICDGLKREASAENKLLIENALLDYRRTHKNGQFSFHDFLKQKMNCDFLLFKQLQTKPLRLIINESRSRLDQNLGHSLQSVTYKYFDVSLDYIGYADFDNAVWQSVKNKEHVLLEKPFTPAAGQFLSICKQLIQPDFHAQSLRAVI